MRRGLALTALGLSRAFAREAQARTLVVPLSLADSTIRAATRVAAGSALSEAASTSIAMLARGVLKAMLLAKVKQIVLGLATLAVITTGAGGLAQGPAQVATMGTESGQKNSVAVARPPSMISTKPLVFPGTTALDPTRVARIRARFAPARVVELAQVSDRDTKTKQTMFRDLRPGDKVSKGDLLAVFQSVDVGSKKNDLLQPLIQLELDQKIKEQENRWSRVIVRSPIDGVVIESNIHKDEIVVDNTQNLFQIADVSRLLVQAKCPEEKLPALQALNSDKRRWTVRTVGATSAAGLSGPIVDINYFIDSDQHTAVIKGYVENPQNRIRAGQYVTVSVNIPPPDGVVEIPAEALVDDGKQSLVLVQPDPAGHQFTMRRVHVTRRQGGKVLVRSTPIPKEEQLTAAEAQQGLLPKEPLRPGERVLVRGALESVEKRLGALERKLDQVLEALGATRRPPAAKGGTGER